MLNQSLKIIVSLGLTLFFSQAIAEPQAKMLDNDASFCNVFRALNGEDVPDECKIDSSRIVRKTRGIQKPSSFKVATKPRSAAFSELINFDYNSSEILPRFHETLNTLLAVIQNEKMRSKTIRIEGHTDIVGSARYNERLSKKRALAVKNYLVEQGVNSNRIEIEGYGFQYLYHEEHPKDPENRRVEIVNLDS